MLVHLCASLATFSNSCAGAACCPANFVSELVASYGAIQALPPSPATLQASKGASMFRGLGASKAFAASFARTQPCMPKKACSKHLKDDARLLCN